MHHIRINALVLITAMVVAALFLGKDADWIQFANTVYMWLVLFDDEQ